MSIPPAFLGPWKGQIKDDPGHAYSRKRPYGGEITLYGHGGKGLYRMAQGPVDSTLSLSTVISPSEIVLTEVIGNSLKHDTLYLAVTNNGELECRWQKGGYQSRAVMKP
jgi:hypothetical protein